MSKKLLKISETAKILDATVRRAYSMARSGIFPVVRLGRQVRVDPDALEEWIKKGGKSLAGGWRQEMQNDGLSDQPL